MSGLGPTLTTGRLVLRPPAAVDFDGWAGLMADEGSARFIGGAQPAALAWRNMAAVTGAWTLRGFGMFSVVEREGGRWIGRVGPWFPHGWPGQEVGWALIRDAWGRGYAREAATACLDWVFDELHWAKVIHCIDPANAASIILARRLGSSFRGQAILPPPIDATVDIWGQSAVDWRARRR
ncbi:GNAT family N-acetyltransferase [Caulobacter sp. S45]|uniref:GNAT family N-acetyltransferase n=1 Tax=Caulobacter sp. S45 TaxID=1641861 RepID=UPI001575B67F|nr:GNAT family N-acetyltransferase [Caulobacter sp. S45]